MTSAYPLAWPPTMPRLPGSKREKGTFKTSLAGALQNVRTSLTLFGRDSQLVIPAESIVLSSNCSLGIEKPADPGVAVWFLWDGEQRCIAVDRYETPAANLQAIHHVLEARRIEVRHGTLNMVRATFMGLKALPAPRSGRPWYEVFGLPPNSSPQSIEPTFKRLAAERHPDKGGSADAMAELNAARTEALRDRG